MSGYLYAATVPVDTVSDLFITTALTVVGPLAGTRWSHCTFKSLEALLGENAGTELPLGSPFEYDIFIRNGDDGHVLIVAAKRRIVERLLERERADRSQLEIQRRAIPLHRVRVSVHRMVMAALNSSTSWAISRLDANIVIGDALRFVSFYGNDIGQSGTFQRISGALRFYACTLKRRNREGDQFHVDSQGRVRCADPTDSRAVADRILAYLSQTGCLKTDKNLWVIGP